MRALWNACLRGKGAKSVSEAQRGTTLTDRSGFSINGVNENSAIESATGLTGVSWEILDQRCRAADSGLHFDKSKLIDYRSTVWAGDPMAIHRMSMNGFIRPDQTVKQVILTDNQKVLDMGLTHQRLAHPLLLAIQAFEVEYAKNEKKVSFAGFEESDVVKIEIEGQKYEIRGKAMASIAAMIGIRPASGESAKGMIQGSPFDDHFGANWIVQIKNIATGKSLEIDALTPYLIKRYGFYQGGDFRVAPEKIAEFFGMAPQK